MKSYIHRINQYLLERHPNIWNTRLIWMLSISLVIHIVFFIFGLVSLTSPSSLHERGVWTIFFENGAIHFSVMLSVLLLVVWLINMFKNNAFKNFYPVSRWQLFSQFLLYFIIILFSTTFYYSYNFGLKTYISSAYEDVTLKDDIEKANMAAIFFSHDIEDYTIDNKRFPSIFSELYCETTDEFIDIDRPFYEFLDFKYQFYSLKKEVRKFDTSNYLGVEPGYVYNTQNDSIQTFFYKDSVVDVSSYLKSAYPTYNNYSATFHTSKIGATYDIYSDNYYYSNDYEYYDKNLEYSEKAKLSSQKTQELLKRNNPKEIKQTLADFLLIAKKYEIEANITSDTWFKLIYHPVGFEVKSLIRDEKKPADRGVYEDFEKTLLQQFNINNTTDFYIRTNDLRNAFENIEVIKSSSVISENIHVFIWIAFFLSSLIFVFRISGLKSLLFTIITIGLLSVFVALVATLSHFLLQFSNNSVELFVAYFVFFLGTIILAIPIFFAKKLKKQIIAVCMNITIGGFVLYVLLIIGIISIHQSHYCDEIYNHTYRYDCPILIVNLGIYTSYILLASGLLFLYFYTAIIKKWKALAEG